MSFRSQISRAVLVLPLALAVGAACASEVVSQEPQIPVTSGAGSDDVLATIDGEPITIADLDSVIGDELATLEFQYGSQRYQLLRSGLESLLRERMIDAAAAEEGITGEELVERELAGQINITDEQIDSWYAANQSRLQERPLETLRPSIRQFLYGQQEEELLGALTERLAATLTVERRLEPFRVALDLAGHPAIGPEDAPVTLVEFSDFECPFCRGFGDTLERVKDEYAGRVRIVFRQFPLRQIHSHADKAAQASLCASEQGKFWEIHDLMFAEQQKLTVTDLNEKAGRLGLDTAAFSACLDSDRYAEQVEKDLQAGARLGVTGTPALFINGRPMNGGAVPFETIAEIINDELERARR